MLTLNIHTHAFTRAQNTGICGRNIAYKAVEMIINTKPEALQHAAETTHPSYDLIHNTLTGEEGD